MFLGYNTNGFAHHDVFDAIELLAEIGYRGVAITIDHEVLSPREDWRGQLRRLRTTLERLGMRSTIETGARFLLDQREKHEPTLISPDPAARARRIEFYKHAIRCAAELESTCVSLWSGALRSPLAVSQAMRLLTEGLEETVQYAAQSNVVIGFEPEPGMLVDSLERFNDLLTQFDAPHLRLTLDVGHLQCQGELPIVDQVRRWSGRLVNVHLEDMCFGRHEHLMFGEGEIDFPPVLQALADVGYQGGVHVELSRHSHLAPEAARRAFAFVRPLIERTGASHG